MAFLSLIFLSPGFKLGFYFLYVVSVPLTAVLLRVGSKGNVFGFACIATLIVSICCFFICAILTGPPRHSADPVGANAMTNLFELVIYPFKFAPLMIPVIPCWILAAIYEKWHVAFHIGFSLILALIALVNLNIVFNILINPDVLDWFFA